MSLLSSRLIRVRLGFRQRLRLLSFSHLPSPTWSISSLELDRQHEPISYEELSALAKRALIKMPSPDSQPSSDRGTKPNKINTDQLCQDVGNIMHMIQQVQRFSSLDAAGDSLTDIDLYDSPRGLSSLRVRTEGSTDEEEDETKAVWDSWLKSKTIKDGSYHYFVIATNRTQ